MCSPWEVAGWLVGLEACSTSFSSGEAPHKLILEGEEGGDLAYPSPGFTGAAILK